VSGTIGAREDRQVIPQAVGTADVSRDFSMAGNLAARQGEQIAGVLGRLGSAASGASQTEATRLGEENAMLEPLQRDAQGRLAPPDLRQRFWLGAGEARRREVLASRYGAEFLSDNLGRLLELRQGAGGDPEAFVAVARAHRDGVLEAVPAVLRPSVMQGMEQEIRRHVQSMQGEKLARDHRAAQEAVQANLTRGAQDLTTSLSSGSYVDGIVGVESGGNPEARPRNADGSLRSSAFGLGQFTNGTWMAFARANPGLFEGLSQDQILAKRSDEGLSRRAIAWNAEQNAPALRTAGFVPSSANLALAHYLGPAGAVRALRADPATPMSQVFSADEARANPEDARRAVGEVVGRYRRRFGDAPPADGQIAGQVQGMVRQIEQAVSANLMTPTAGQEAIRRVTQVLPLTIRTLQQGVAAGDGAGAMVQALTDGPGSPGWRPEWNALREPERRELAQLMQSSLSHRRSEANYARLTAEREASVEIVRLSQELTALNERAEGGRLPDADMRRRGQITEEISRLSLITRSDAGVQAIRGTSNADQRGDARRGADGEARTIIGRSLTDIVGGDRGDGDEMTAAQGRAAVEALRPYADLPLASQARMLAADAREAEQRARAQAAAVEPRLRYARAFAGAIGDPRGMGQAQLDNNTVHQTVQLESLPNPTDLLDPANREALRIGARTGVVQQAFQGLALGALASRDPQALEQVAALHDVMMRDAGARAAWSGVMGSQLTAALTGLQAQMLTLNPRAPGYQVQVERLAQEASRVARSDPKLIEELRAEIPDLDTQVTTDRTKALRDAGGDAVPPPAMTQAWNAAYLTALAANGRDREAASVEATRQVQGRFSLSLLGLTSVNFMPRAAGDRVAPLSEAQERWMRSVGLGRFVDAHDRTVERPRWAEAAPERFMAPYGAGGERSMRWLVESTGDLFRQHAPSEAGRLKLGVNAWVMLDRDAPTMQVPDPRDPSRMISSPAYRVWFRVGDSSRGMLNPLYERNAEGQVTSRAVRIPILAEMLRHEQRWIDSGGAAAAEQQRQRGRDLEAEGSPVRRWWPAAPVAP
jgi:hypothetical protein